MTDLIEYSESGGTLSKWRHDRNHGPWQATAPGWAVEEFAHIMETVSDGHWSNGCPVGPLLDGHLVYCEGIWVGDELIVNPSSEPAYYEATVRWRDGELRPLLLWRWDVYR